MEYKKLEEINKKLNTTPIKGKDYVEVNQRILAFRELFPEGQILTEILNMQDGICTMKATIVDNGQILATGHAQEKESSSFINKTSYIENCETSAVGRALGMLGIGITNSIASAEEVINAMNNQGNELVTDIQAKTIYSMLLKQGLTNEQIIDTLNKKYGIDNTSKLTVKQYTEILNNIKTKE